MNMIGNGICERSNFIIMQIIINILLVVVAVVPWCFNQDQVPTAVVSNVQNNFFYIREWAPTSSWFFFRQHSSSFRHSSCDSRSDLHRVSSSRTWRKPLISASTLWRRASSVSYLSHGQERQKSQPLAEPTIKELLQRCHTLIFLHVPWEIIKTLFFFKNPWARLSVGKNLHSSIAFNGLLPMYICCPYILAH